MKDIFKAIPTSNGSWAVVVAAENGGWAYIARNLNRARAGDIVSQLTKVLERY